MDEAQGEIEAAAHTAGVSAHTPLGGLGEADTFEQLVGASLHRRGVYAVQHGLQVEQFAAAHQGIDRRVLQGHADAAAHVVGLGDNVEPGDSCRACGRREQGGEHAHRRALACAVGPEKAEDLTFGDAEVHPVDRADGTLAAAEVAYQALGDDGGGG